MNTNTYTSSSNIFLRVCASRISEDMDNDDVLQAVLNFAVGIERLLKGILFNINPTYILVSPEFNHSMQVLYKSKIIKSTETKAIFAKAPVANVITFRNSLLRATAVSQAALKNKNRLFGLSNLRDIVAHHDLEKFDYKSARTLLQRDFYFILLDFHDEKTIDKIDCFGDYENSLITVSKQHKQDIKNIIRLKLEEHRKQWEKIKDNPQDVRDRTIVTDEQLESNHRYETTCPACNQRAVLFSEPDYVYDFETSEKNEVGEFVRLIDCSFCGLVVYDGNELDELGYGESFHPLFGDGFDDDIPF